MPATMPKRKKLEELDPDTPGTISWTPTPETWRAILAYRRARKAASETGSDPGWADILETAVSAFLDRRRGR